MNNFVKLIINWNYYLNGVIILIIYYLLYIYLFNKAFNE